MSIHGIFCIKKSVKVLINQFMLILSNKNNNSACRYKEQGNSEKTNPFFHKTMNTQKCTLNFKKYW